MARATDSRAPEGSDQALFWSGRLSLTRRILLVNSIAVVMLAGGIFYLDGLRGRLIIENLNQTSTETAIVGTALEKASPDERTDLIARLGGTMRSRLRLFTMDGKMVTDSWILTKPNFALPDLKQETLQRRIARRLDDGIDFLVDAEELPPFTHFPVPAEFKKDGPHLAAAMDRTHMISARQTVHTAQPMYLITDRNVKEIRRIVRAERQQLGGLIALAALLSVLLSLFLARTIVDPLRRLAIAAVKVRLGRAREVTVPRLPSRNDEIGMLARSLSDMSSSLRQRIDASESFAADVTHELKNPLASLRSAVETLNAVKTPAQRTQMLRIINEDVGRLDRLINDVADLSRVDAQLTRVLFQRIDLGMLIEGLLKARETRGTDDKVKIASFGRRAGYPPRVG